jgi:hypothetical protein
MCTPSSCSEPVHPSTTSRERRGGAGAGQALTWSRGREDAAARRARCTALTTSGLVVSGLEGNGGEGPGGSTSHERRAKSGVVLWVERLEEQRRAPRGISGDAGSTGGRCGGDADMELERGRVSGGEGTSTCITLEVRRRALAPFRLRLPRPRRSRASRSPHISRAPARPVGGSLV